MALQEGSSLLKAVFSCLLGWTGPTLVLSDSDENHEGPQDEQDLQLPSEVLGQRLLLWFLTLAGFYGLVWILDDFTGEWCNPPRPKEAAIRGWRRIPAQDSSSPPRRHCNMQSSLRSLGQTEQDLVTLLYKLRKHKVALATGWLQGKRRCRQIRNDLVIYTIQDET